MKTKGKGLLKSKEFKIMLYYICMAILFWGVYSYLFPSNDSIFKSTDFNSIMGDIADIFVNGIFFIPVLIKVFVIVIVIIIQITANFSKKIKES